MFWLTRSKTCSHDNVTITSLNTNSYIFQYPYHTFFKVITDVIIGDATY